MTTIGSSRLPAVPDDTILRLALAAHLARYRGQSRDHVHSDLSNFLTWCQQRDVAPLAASRPQIELYVRWMQEVKQQKPSTVSRRLSVIVGFYRTCVIDNILEYSPADYVRRPHVPPESPTLGLRHLQFEAMLTTARDSTNLYDFALVTMLGLLGLRIFEATGANIPDLSDSHGHQDRPPVFALMLECMTDQTSHKCWTVSQLRAELARFQSELITAGKAPDTVQTYVDRPERFITFLEGKLCALAFALRHERTLRSLRHLGRSLNEACHSRCSNWGAPSRT